ncbi:MAG: DNA-formamidopyrimidine glycosylase family protein [Chloroflexota bacterium]
MPELPEVETFVRQLKPALVGKTILAADLRWNRTLARTLTAPSPKKFKEQIMGQKIIDVGRRAKYFNIQLKDYSLLIHLRMSGDLLIKNSTIGPEKHDRLILKLSENKSLIFNDTRKFGRVWLTTAQEEVLGKLGPEPFSKEFTS